MEESINSAPLAATSRSELLSVNAVARAGRAHLHDSAEQRAFNCRECCSSAQCTVRISAEPSPIPLPRLLGDTGNLLCARCRAQIGHAVVVTMLADGCSSLTGAAPLKRQSVNLHRDRHELFLQLANRPRPPEAAPSSVSPQPDA